MCTISLRGRDDILFIALGDDYVRISLVHLDLRCR